MWFVLEHRLSNLWVTFSDIRRITNDHINLTADVQTGCQAELISVPFPNVLETGFDERGVIPRIVTPHRRSSGWCTGSPGCAISPPAFTGEAMIHLTDLMEPEETVGNLWHALVSREGQAEGRAQSAEHAVAFAAMRPSIATLFRALGGGSGVEIVAAPLVASRHRFGRLRRIGTPREMISCTDFDGHRLRLPPEIDCFSTRDLNRSAYLWLAALAAMTQIPAPPANPQPANPLQADPPHPDPMHPDPLQADRAQIALMAAATERAYAACPGLRRAYAELTHALLTQRNRSGLPPCEAEIERMILDQLAGQSGRAQAL